MAVCGVRWQMTKYRNRKTVINGITFDSVAESARYAELHRLLMAGEITSLQCQFPIVLSPGVLLRGAKRKSPALRYFADFCYFDSHGRRVLEDVKGAPLTTAYKIKRHLMAVQGIYITEIRA
jgi:hypothetical protein